MTNKTTAETSGTINLAALPLTILGLLLGLGVVTLNASRVVTAIAALAVLSSAELIKLEFSFGSARTPSKTAFTAFATFATVMTVLSVAALVNIFSNIFS